MTYDSAAWTGLHSRRFDLALDLFRLTPRRWWRSDFWGMYWRFRPLPMVRVSAEAFFNESDLVAQDWPYRVIRVRP